MQFQLLKFLGISFFWFTTIVVIAFLPLGAPVSASRCAEGALPAFGETVSAKNRAAGKAGGEREIGLPDVVKRTMSVHFGATALMDKSLAQFASDLPVEAQFKKPAGVFVTLSRNGKTRACWGSIYPQQETIAKATVFATLGALTKEYRYPPIKPYEWKMLKTQVTVIKSIEPIESISLQNPLRDGLMVRAGGKAGVLLPGEASDAYYQLVQCRLKAGIRPGESCQLYRLRTEIYD